ncbi:MAG: FlgD immunoglobulin-like domain containing protein [Candidatus Krumholzibacteriia bacterium]
MHPLKLQSLMLLAAVLSSFSHANAEENPIRQSWSAAYSDAARSPAAGTSEFVCGTYRGNENESKWFYHQYASQAQGVSAALDTVFDDVWVVEDDGTLLFSGLNVFDTDLQTFRFVPNGVGGYDVSAPAASFDPVLGANLSLGDDENLTVALMFAFTYFGTSWTSVHANSNGIVGFGADVNPSGFFDSNDFFSEIPKIAAYFMDLNPAAGGAVFYKAEPTRSTFTWNTIPEFGTGNVNTVQMVLRDDGSIDVTFNGITSNVAANGAPITFGIHPGGNPSLEIISFSDDLPFGGAVSTGIYENYLNITQPLVNEVALMQRFYQSFPDSFFQIIFLTNFAQTMGGFANERNISNNVQGIGLGLFDNSTLYGSNGVLESRCNMNQLAVWPTNPAGRFTGSQNNFLTIMGQEAGHRWGAFVNFMDSTGTPSNMILGRADAHWSFYADVDHSCLEGGDWQHVSGTLFTTPTMIDFFSDIDQYLFGLRSPEEVSETFYVSSPTNDLPQNRDNGTPPQGTNAVGTPVVVTIDDIIAAEGLRVPTAATENKDLRQAFVLIHQNGTTPTAAELAKIASFRRAWEDYFEQSVDGRITCNTSITQDFPVGTVQGRITDALTTLPVGDVLVTSVERGFTQFIPGGGRYTFRYMADVGSGSAESITLTFFALGYGIKTVNVSVDYGTDVVIDCKLDPIPVGIGDGGIAPRATALHSNVPNPFNPRTTIHYTVGTRDFVRLSVYDVTGRLVRRLVDGAQEGGPHAVTWDARDGVGRPVSSGVYFVRLEATGDVRTRTIVLLK